MRAPRCILWAALALLAPAVVSADPLPSGQVAAAVRVVKLEDIKVQWFSKDDEDLPAWISGSIAIGPLGGLEGRLIETALADDGTDDDGDPMGFDTKVFETLDGSLTGLGFGPGRLDFTTVYSDPDAGAAVYRLRRYGAPGAWTLSVAQRGKDGDYAGRNRFPLMGTVRHGVLTITTAPAGDEGSDDTL